MEGKVLGISMSVFGALGLVLAFVFMNNTDSSKHLSLLLASGIGGVVIFFTGIWLSGRTGVRPGMGAGAGMQTGMGAGAGMQPGMGTETADNENFL
jgi:hypothetical protein